MLTGGDDITLANDKLGRVEPLLEIDKWSLGMSAWAALSNDPSTPVQTAPVSLVTVSTCSGTAAEMGSMKQDSSSIDFADDVG